MPASCRDIERTQISVPKGAVCRPIHRDRVRLSTGPTEQRRRSSGGPASRHPAQAMMFPSVSRHMPSTPAAPRGRPVQRYAAPYRLRACRRLAAGRPGVPAAVIIALATYRVRSSCENRMPLGEVVSEVIRWSASSRRAGANRKIRHGPAPFCAGRPRPRSVNQTSFAVWPGQWAGYADHPACWATASCCRRLKRVMQCWPDWHP